MKGSSNEGARSHRNKVKCSWQLKQKCGNNAEFLRQFFFFSSYTDQIMNIETLRGQAMGLGQEPKTKRRVKSVRFEFVSNNEVMNENIGAPCKTCDSKELHSLV